MEVQLTAEELYFLGMIMQAKYIDYAYIAAMSDIHDNVELARKECFASLEKKGIITEDFSGDIWISDEAEDVLKPIFFGEAEVSVDICVMGDEKYVSAFKFHLLEGRVAMVREQDGLFVVKTVAPDEIRTIIKGIVPEDYPSEAPMAPASAGLDNISKLISVKYGSVSGAGEVFACMEINGALYRENAEGELLFMSSEEFLAASEQIIKEAI